MKHFYNKLQIDYSIIAVKMLRKRNIVCASYLSKMIASISSLFQLFCCTLPETTTGKYIYQIELEEILQRDC